MTHSEELFYHAINIALGGNIKEILKLQEKYVSWDLAWSDSSFLDKNTTLDQAAKELSSEEFRLILKNQPSYPALLREMPWSPAGIYVKGILPEPFPKTLAVVGTRRASPSSLKLAEQFSEKIARAGVLIVSGLAFGVDAAAHKGALRANKPTIAVLPRGLRSIYPQSHAQLANDILMKGGALLSEYPLDTEPLPYRFLERNRIISGLSHGTLLVEAPERSGSLATARFAMEQNRSLFVVPGSATQNTFKGSHAMIREGAELVTAPEEVLESLGIHDQKSAASWSHLGSEAELVFQAISSAPQMIQIDKIIELTNLKAPQVSHALTLLILEGAIYESGAGYQVRIQ